MPLTEDEEFELLSLERERAMGASASQPQKLTPAQEKFSAPESFIRGGVYGGLQQPRDVIAAGVAKLSGGVPFNEALAAANQMSLEGKQGQAMGEDPAAFGLGQIGGQIAISAIPAGLATKGLSAIAPIAGKAPLVGGALENLASNIATTKGITGVLGQGALQGGSASLISQGDLSGAGPGALTAGVFGLAGKIAQPIAKTATSAVRKGYANVLQKAGIDDLTAAQLTGNPTLELIESVMGSMPFTAGPSKKLTEKQLGQFTKAALSKAGIQGELATPEVLAKAEKSFSNKYENILKNEVIKIDQPVLDTLDDIAKNKLKKLGPAKSIVKSYVDDIKKAGGQITSDLYQRARTDLRLQAKSMQGNDPFTANILRTIRDSLDEAAERSLPAKKQVAWKELNRQYANYKTIQDAASKVSKDSLEGYLSPTSLLQSAKRANPSKGQAGYGDLYSLARAGRGILTDSIPNSGTAQRQLIQEILTGQVLGQAGLGALGGAAGYGASGGDPLMALAGAGLALGGPRAVQSLMNSQAGKSYLTKGIPGAEKIFTDKALQELARGAGAAHSGGR